MTACLALVVIMPSCLDPCGRRIIDEQGIYSCIQHGDAMHARLRYNQGEPPYDRCNGSLYHALRGVKDKETIRFVEELQLDIEYEDSYGNTAIFETSGEVLQRLLQKGANVHHRNNEGETALFCQATYAICSRSSDELEQRMENIKILIGGGSEINAKVNGKTILDDIIEGKLSKKSILLGCDVALKLSNRSKIYTFLCQCEAKTSWEP